MSRRSPLFVFALGGLLLGALPACKKHAAGTSCDDVGTTFNKVAAADLAKVIPDADHREALNAEIPPMHDALVAQCEGQAWADAVRTCMAAASSGQALQTCQGQLTPAQQAALAKALAPGATEK